MHFSIVRVLSPELEILVTNGPAVEHAVSARMLTSRTILIGIKPSY